MDEWVKARLADVGALSMREASGKPADAAATPSEPVLAAQKEGRFITKDGRRIFIGGPESGGGSTAGSPESFAEATTRPVVQHYRLEGGTTKPEVLSYEDDGQGIFKELYPEDAIGHDGNSEVAAYRLNQLLGGQEVPETVYTEYEGRQGTSQRFIPGATLGVKVTIAAIQALDRGEVDRVVALDVIINNGDRHGGNFLVKDGHLIAIDHGHASWGLLASRNPTRTHDLITARYFETWGNTTVTVAQVWGRYNHRGYQFAPEAIAAWKGITREQFDAAMQGISTGRRVNLENAWNNLQYIVEHGRV